MPSFVALYGSDENKNLERSYMQFSDLNYIIDNTAHFGLNVYIEMYNHL